MKHNKSDSCTSADSWTALLSFLEANCPDEIVGCQRDDDSNPLLAESSDLSKGNVNYVEKIPCDERKDSITSIDCLPPMGTGVSTYSNDVAELTNKVPMQVSDNDVAELSINAIMQVSDNDVLTEPTDKTYVQVTDNDVLFGKGSGSSRHPGNQSYLSRIRDDYQKAYKILDADGKRALIHVVVSWVELRGGRFLAFDKTPEGHLRYYVASDKKVKDKVSRALRGDPRCT
jgi:hypothetical protein